MPFADQLEAAGITYVPFSVSCWGRLHPAALQMLSAAAKRMARRDGSSNHSAVLQRLFARVTTVVMRRAARMLLRCLPLGRALEDPAEPPIKARLCQHAELRAGHPGLCLLPPLYPVPPRGTAARS